MKNNKAFKALCKKHGLSEAEGLRLFKQYSNGGVKKYENGDDVYGDEAVGRILGRRAKFLANIPEWEDLGAQKEGLINWISDLERLGFDKSTLPYDPETTDIDRKKFGEIAGVAQNWVSEYAPSSVADYSKEAKITRTGIQTLRKKYNDGTLDAMGLNPDDLSSIKEVLDKHPDKDLNTLGLSPLEEKILMRGLSQEEARDANFIDNEWYYRRPEFKDVTFKNQEEYDKFIAQNTLTDEVDGKQYFDVGQGVYINPIIESEEVVEEKKGEGFQKLDMPLVAQANTQLAFPMDMTLFPEGLQPHLKVKRRFDTVDPVKISYEENLKETARQEQFQNDQLANLPDNLRRAAMANLSATSQENINKTISETNRMNAANAQQVEQFNIGQKNLEENYLAADALDYEKRQLTALAKTQDDWHGFVDYKNKLNQQRFSEQTKANTMNSMFENFNVNPTGGVALDPTKPLNFFLNNNNIV